MIFLHLEYSAHPQEMKNSAYLGHVLSEQLHTMVVLSRPTDFQGGTGPPFCLAFFNITQFPDPQLSFLLNLLAPPSELSPGPLIQVQLLLLPFLQASL